LAGISAPAIVTAFVARSSAEPPCGALIDSDPYGGSSNSSPPSVPINGCTPRTAVPRTTV
jgi:hypothetical protein